MSCSDLTIWNFKETLHHTLHSYIYKCSTDLIIPRITLDQARPNDSAPTHGLS